MDNYDFSGWATRANLKCADGRVIMPGAFKNDDGRTVPLVWMHNHGDINAVIGHALLENREDGVYAYCSFNDTPNGRIGKEIVEHGDVEGLSICAKIKQAGSNVVHGVINELSLVLAGANPGASIIDIMNHSDDDGDEAIIFNDDKALEISHANTQPSEKQKTVKDIFDSMTEEQKTAAYAIIGEVMEDDEEDDDDQNDGNTVKMEHADTTTDGKTIKEVFDTLTEEQKNVVYFLIGEVMPDETDDNEEDNNDDLKTGGSNSMKHNVFDSQEGQEMYGVIMHADGTPVLADEIPKIFKDAKRYGSLKDSFLQHGIENIDYLFPEARTLTTEPTFISDNMEWVKEVMNAIHKSPFAKVKSIFADITEEEARAKGYIKGKLKKEEVFTLLKRTTSPTSVYKKQKMDRDDMLDIVDIDSAMWVKAEMRMKLDEELARAFLLGDGRLASSDDKINEQNIRPVAKDDDLFTVHVEVQVQSSATEDDKAKAFIRSVIKTRKQYKGSGNPVLFTTEDMLADMLLLTDEMGRDLYTDEASLAKKLRVRKIVTVPPMETATGKNGNPLVGIVVNLRDYNVGADKGGAINMFDDFDIDYNQQKYLIETRCSGALTVPFSAMAFEIKTNG